MSATITMTAEGLDSLRTGVITVRATDSSGRLVTLFPVAAWESRSSRPISLTAVLSPKDLDWIESTAEGLIVADTTGTTGWTLQMEAFQ